jgi:hypothetical protein
MPSLFPAYLTDEPPLSSKAWQSAVETRKWLHEIEVGSGSGAMNIDSNR